MNAAEIAAKHNATVAKPGHNSAPPLQEFVERMNHLLDEKDAVAADIKELNAEAKTRGVDPKALASVLKRKRETKEAKAKREAQQDVLNGYLLALKMLD